MPIVHQELLEKSILRNIDSAHGFHICVLKCESGFLGGMYLLKSLYGNKF